MCGWCDHAAGRHSPQSTVMARDDDWQAGRLETAGVGSGEVDDRCNIEHLAEGLRVIADGPFLCRAVSGAFACRRSRQ